MKRGDRLEMQMEKLCLLGLCRYIKDGIVQPLRFHICQHQRGRAYSILC